MFHGARPPLLVAVVLAMVTLSACSSSDSPSDRADITPEALAALQADLADLQAQVAMLMQRADITPADLQALQGQVATLMQRADITPADLQALQAQVATLMQRADITPADLQALQDQVATLMQRADITPADLQALQDRLAAAEQALVLLQQALDPRILEDDWRHEAAAYARAVTGGQEPTLPSALHDAVVRQIAAGSDTITMLHFWNPGTGVWEQTDPNCNGTTCDWSDPNNPDPLTKDNFVPPQEDITILPVMRRGEVELHLSTFAGEDDLGPWAGNAYAAPLEHVMFGTTYQEWDSGQASSLRWVVGDATGANPVAGTASWSGVMVGAGTSETDSAWIQGDAGVTVHFGTSPAVDVIFDNVVCAHRECQTAAAIDPWMGVPLANGLFQSGSNFGDVGDRYLEGRFFGPDAEEVAGVFYDWLSSDPNLYFEGAFGAVRDQQ